MQLQSRGTTTPWVMKPYSRCFYTVRLYSLHSWKMAFFGLFNFWMLIWKSIVLPGYTVLKRFYILCVTFFFVLIVGKKIVNSTVNLGSNSLYVDRNVIWYFQIVQKSTLYLASQSQTLSSCSNSGNPTLLASLNVWSVCCDAVIFFVIQARFVFKMSIRFFRIT